MGNSLLDLRSFKNFVSLPGAYAKYSSGTW